MTAAERIRNAKDDLLEAVGQPAWLAGIGIARRGRGLTLVVSVRRGQRQRAERVLEDLTLGVPCEIREVGPIRAR